MSENMGKWLAEIQIIMDELDRVRWGLKQQEVKCGFLDEAAQSLRDFVSTQIRARAKERNDYGCQN